MAKMCGFDGCCNPVFSKGFCAWHQPKKEHSSLNPKPYARAIRPVSETMAANLAKYRTKRDRYFKDHPVCEFPGCRSRKITLHHKRGRVGAFLTDIRYFCSLCGFHHTWVNEHNKEAAKMGLVESRLGK